MHSATQRMISLLESIPVLTASAPMSVTMASIWASIISVGVSSTELTPRVFWAVMVVMAQVPNTPMAPKVLRSAWMPGAAPGVGTRDGHGAWHTSGGHQHTSRIAEIAAILPRVNRH